MDIKTARAAILVESRKPLIVDEITLPDSLDYGQVLKQFSPDLNLRDSQTVSDDRDSVH
jgi:hypothetical protein